MDAEQIDLGPTSQQLVNAFIWTVIGAAIGLVFLLSLLIGEKLNWGSLMIGLVLMVLSIASAFLEYRALPGAKLQFMDDQLIVQPRVGEPVTFDYRQISWLRLVPGPHAKPTPEDPKAIASSAMSYQVRGVYPRRGLKRPNWYLRIRTKSPANSLELAVGGDAARVHLLQSACLKHRLRYRKDAD